MHPEIKNAAGDFSKILTQAKREIGYRDHGLVDGQNPGTRSQRAAATGGFMDLRELNMPALVDGAGSTRALAGRDVPAGKLLTLDASLIDNSRVARAGAKIIVAAERPAPKNDVGAFYADAGEFVLIEAATFAAVNDGDDATDATLPFHTASIVWPDAPSIAFTATIDRKTQKNTTYDLEGALVKAIVLGLAREADRVLLAAIIAATPTAFTLAKAATRGLEFAELRALIGTAGTGATVGEDGTLRAAGVRGELTPTIAGTVIGSFTRAAVAIHPEIRVVAKRLNVVGELEMTVFASMLPLIPDPTAFWAAS